MWNLPHVDFVKSREHSTCILRILQTGRDLLPHAVHLNALLRPSAQDLARSVCRRDFHLGHSRLNDGCWRGLRRRTWCSCRRWWWGLGSDWLRCCSRSRSWLGRSCWGSGRWGSSCWSRCSGRRRTRLHLKKLLAGLDSVAILHQDFGDSSSEGSGYGHGRLVGLDFHNGRVGSK